MYVGLYWGYIGIMENKLETTIMGYIGLKFGGVFWDNGKENGNYYSILEYIYLYVSCRKMPLRKRSSSCWRVS